VSVSGIVVLKTTSWVRIDGVAADASWKSEGRHRIAAPPS